MKIVILSLFDLNVQYVRIGHLQNSTDFFGMGSNFTFS